jgi:hypothetical protein
MFNGIEIPGIQFQNQKMTDEMVQYNNKSDISQIKIISPDTNYELRNANNFIVPFARTESFKKIPLFALPKIWNEEIGYLRLQHNKITFQIALKDHLLESLS